ASINLPQIPASPGGGGGDGGGSSGLHPGGKVSGSFNGAAFAGYRIEKSKWSTDGGILWAGLAADSSSPRAYLSLHGIYGQIMGGREILPDLPVEGGVRGMALKITAEVGTFPAVSRKPGVWDPLIGLSYRKHFGRKWRVNLHADGGGFGVGSDVDV